MTPHASHPFSATAFGGQRGKASRRQFIQFSAMFLAGAALSGCQTSQTSAEPIVDIHQHLGYSGRSDEVLLAHQRNLGITKTVLLPAGRPMYSATTHDGVCNGLEAKCLGNEECYRFAQAHSDAYAFAANEVPDAPGAQKEIEKYLKLGAVMIAEQKFGIECDSPEMQRIYQIAADYRVPVLMHWQHHMYNYGFNRFYKILAKYPRTTFIGHAQTWWANIDSAYVDDTANLYPRGHVTPGGITDRLLSDHANIYGDLSAGSGLNALARDEDQGRSFIERHQDKLLYGSDCNDGAPGASTSGVAVSDVGSAPSCQGAQTIALLRRLAPSPGIQRKLFRENARRVLKIHLVVK